MRIKIIKQITKVAINLIRANLGKGLEFLSEMKDLDKMCPIDRHQFQESTIRLDWRELDKQTEDAENRLSKGEELDSLINNEIIQQYLMILFANTGFVLKVNLSVKFGVKIR